MITIYDFFGNLIRQHRIKLGYTQETLAGLASVSNVYISKLERGQVNPSCKILQRLFDALEIDTSNIFIYDTNSQF